MITDDQPKPKVAFYEHISTKLLKEREKINDPSESLNAAMRMGVYLGVLLNGRMPVVEAHRLAELHNDLPSFLRRSTQPNLAFLAEATLVDLRNRKAEGIEAKNRENMIVDVPLPAGQSADFGGLN